MEADIDISDSDICVKECVVDRSKACFLIITNDTVIRLSMGASLLKRTVSLIRSVIPEDCKPAKNNKECDGLRRKCDVSLSVVDVRVGGPSYYRGPSKPELRLYTNKEHDHSVQMNLSWGQLALLFNLMQSMQELAVA